MGHEPVGLFVVEGLALVPVIIVVVAAVVAKLLSDLVGSALHLPERWSLASPRYEQERSHSVDAEDVPEGLPEGLPDDFLKLNWEWRVPASRKLGFVKLLRLSDIRSVAAIVFGVTVTIAIGLSVSDHSHKTATYVLWYGIPVVSLIIWVTMTLVERGKAIAQKAT